MTRALNSNSEISFEMTHNLQSDPDTKDILEDTEQLLEIRRGNISLQQQQQKKKPIKTRSSPRIARKLRFQKDVSTVEEDMDTTN